MLTVVVFCEMYVHIDGSTSAQLPRRYPTNYMISLNFPLPSVWEKNIFLFNAVSIDNVTIINIIIISS